MHPAAMPIADFPALAPLFQGPAAIFTPALPGAAQAYLAWSLLARHGRPLLWITDSARALDRLHQDLATLAGDRADLLDLYPARESGPTARRAGATPNPDVTGDRLRTLQRALDPRRPPGIIATCIQALLESAPPPDRLRGQVRALHLNAELDLHAFAAELERDAGYRFGPEVLEKGQAALRGGLLDIWPPTEPWPLRLEFFGSTLDSIRAFDPVAQRSREPRDTALIVPAAEPTAAAGDPDANHPYPIFACLPPAAVRIWSEPESIRHHAAMCREMLPPRDPAREQADYDRLRLWLERHRPAGDLAIGLTIEQTGAAIDLGLRPFEGLPAIRGEILHPDMLEAARGKLVENLLQQAAGERQVWIYFSTPGARERFRESYPAAPRDPAGRLHLEVGPLSEGFVCDAANLTVVAESDLYGFRKQLPGRYELHGRRPGPADLPGARIADWTDIQPGELVVHVEQGIGKYLGLYEIEFDGRQQEALAIEYADRARLYVPVAQAHLLSRYVAVGRHRPELHTLGGTRWAREKVAAEKAVHDLAGAMLETQAARNALQGHAFPPDTPWQAEFEAAFPFQETPDQQRAIEEIKRDMESARPMDRLICGDVGYGKTEVAMRAAFKAVMDGRQGAVLVPTTVLAQQHYDTFAERMAAYPIAIEMLSRFRTRAAQAAILRRLAEGAVDIVIGTHRLVQRDVRFADLGLVIIDEEQRFGVAHKERLKQLRQLVDVLTLTATPIPRTLYMSLTGARDMSTIQTPPQDRLPVETIVAQNTDEVVREAVLRELNRGGQVFYLHNRVQTIELARERLRHVVPEARVEVGHGQMSEHRLAAIMHRFVRAEFDVLLCTTIIESGVDIPNVNTILIDRADRFGMADLYQLRGRVGRFKHQAYAYLLLPRHGRLFDTARQRIGAIKRYSSLGAGFKLALRDLEIRGAGNLLGAEQSGHIAAVGFDLYCQLLKRTIARLRGEQPPPLIDVKLRLDFIDLAPGAAADAPTAVLPIAYLEDENLRVGAYRKLAAAATEAEIDELAAEFRDRFGPVPAAVDRLLKIARLRIIAAGRGVQAIEVAGDKVMITRGGEFVMRGNHFPRLKAKDASAKLDELIQLVRTLGT